MQYLKINADDTLYDIIQRVGVENIDAVLDLNDLDRVQNIGEHYYDPERQNSFSAYISRNREHIEEFANSQHREDKLMYSRSQESSDFFEYVASMDAENFAYYWAAGYVNGYLILPDTVQLPSADDVMGDGIQVSDEVFGRAVRILQDRPKESSDPVNLNDVVSYSDSVNVGLAPPTTMTTPMQWFNLPWGKITLYSSLADTAMDFPVYPSGIQDGRKANYETMPDMIYQYEPWQVFTGSGPRTNTYVFDMHRDMWTGNHMDGKCNELIRYCEASCYAEYKGAAVNTALVTLYINGTPHIRGILTDVGIEWDENSPLGHDGFFLHVKLSLTITEVSSRQLSFDSVRNIGLIG